MQNTAVDSTRVLRNNIVEKDDYQQMAAGTNKALIQYMHEHDAECREHELKMVLIVRTDLNMGKGKIAAQCCHAALGLYRDLAQGPDGQELLKEWERFGEVTIVLKGASEDQLLSIQKQADKDWIHSWLNYDAGRTQVEPDTLTVLALGPTVETELTDSLKLL